jgi:hypothetical protein
MERIVLAIFFELIGVLNLTAQNKIQNDCVTAIDTLEKKIVHARICGNEIVDTLKVYDLKGRLTEWQYFGTKDEPNELVQSWSRLYRGLLGVSTGHFNRNGEKVGIWKYYHKKGYLWDEEGFQDGVRIRRTRYKSNGKIAFEY